jgi:hypothetical protein
MELSMSAISEPCLSFNEVSTYQRDGCLICRQPVFPPEKFAGLKACFETILPEGFSPEAMDAPGRPPTSAMTQPGASWA